MKPRCIAVLSCEDLNGASQPVNSTRVFQCPSGSQLDDGTDSYTQTCLLFNSTTVHWAPQDKCHPIATTGIDFFGDLF
jgi:hypothetical protein